MDNIDTRRARTRAPSRARERGEGANHREVDVGPPRTEREEQPTSHPRPERSVADLRETSSLLLREKGLAYLIDDLGHGCPVESGVPADGLEPARCDITGDALGLAAGVWGGLEG